MEPNRSFVIGLCLLCAAAGLLAAVEARNERDTKNCVQCIVAAVLDFAMAFTGIVYSLM